MGHIQTPTPDGPKSRTSERHRALHDALVTATEDVIDADGLHGLRARALAEQVGCSVGAIYNVFPDLDALILAVNRRTLDAIDAAMRAAPPSPDAPASALVSMAEAYLDYVSTHQQRCLALFTHRMTPGQDVPAWYLRQQAAVFAHVEQPLAELCPGAAAEQRALLARTLFSAVHGVVSLGLDQKLAAIAPATLRAQLRVVVEAMAAGLQAACAVGSAATRDAAT